jgi:hypothetical protein
LRSKQLADFPVCPHAYAWRFRVEALWLTEPPCLSMRTGVNISRYKQKGLQKTLFPGPIAGGQVGQAVSSASPQPGEHADSGGMFRYRNDGDN